MITITNGQMTLTVPNSAYRTIYRASGFRPVESYKDSESSIDSYPSNTENASDEESILEKKENLEEPYGEEAEVEEEVDLSEIPLSEMDFYQLESYADQLGLDHRGIRSKKELRALIRNNI